MRIGNIISDFFTDISNFFRSRSVLGVDIGTSSIKIAEISERENKFVLNNYGILETKEYFKRPNLALHTSSLSLEEKRVARLLKILLAEMKTKSVLAIASIPSFVSFSTVIDMPLMSYNETSKVVTFQGPQYIPLQKEEVIMDWMKIGEFKKDGNKDYQHVFIIGISRKIVDVYKNIFKAAGLKLIAVELDGLSLARSLIDSFDRDTVIVDLGAEETQIFIVSGGSLAYVGGTAYSGIHITESIGKSLGITPWRAELLKRKKGSVNPEDSDLAVLTAPFLDVIIQEVNYALDSYKRKYGKIVERVMVVGGGANLKGVDRYFAKQLGLLEAKPNVFRKVLYNVSLEPILMDLNNELSLAVGLGEKYFKK